MSALFISGKSPSQKPHPAMKWSLLMALLVVVVLGLPLSALATPPTVQAPDGPNIGGVFTGAYSFQTYIYCSSGLTFNSEYIGNLDGVHTYNFRGAPDGSLLVSLDGGGNQLVTSCGDPFAAPWVGVASYTIHKNVFPTTPTPVPPTPFVPTPAPVVTPATGGGITPKPSNGRLTPTPVAVSADPTPTETPIAAVATPEPVQSITPTPSASPTLLPAITTVRENGSGASLLAYGLGALGLLLLAGSIAAYLRIPGLRAGIADALLSIKIRVRPMWFKLKMYFNKHVKQHGRDIPRRRGLSAHHHTGKVLAHHHTSYSSLAFLLIISTVLLGAYSEASRAADTQLTLTVLGPPPQFAPTIDSPLDGQHFGAATTTVRGHCMAGLIVEVDRNAAFAGSTMCDAGGEFNLLLTLVGGQNDLVARNIDALMQASPDSGLVTVYYDIPVATPTPVPTATPTPAPTSPTSPSTSPMVSPEVSLTPQPPAPNTPRPSATPSGTVIDPLIIDSQKHYYQGVEPGADIDLSLTITGGERPYKMSIDWGDGRQTDLETTIGILKLQHKYDKSGIQRVIVRAKDTAGREAVMNLVVIVSGVSAVPAGLGGEGGGLMAIAWPLFGLLGLILLSFWLGEHHRESTATVASVQLPKNVPESA